MTIARVSLLRLAPVRRSRSADASLAGGGGGGSAAAGHTVVLWVLGAVKLSKIYSLIMHIFSVIYTRFVYWKFPRHCALSPPLLIELSWTDEQGGLAEEEEVVSPPPEPSCCRHAAFLPSVDRNILVGNGLSV